MRKSSKVSGTCDRSSINLFPIAAVIGFASLLLIATQTRPFEVGVKTGGWMVKVNFDSNFESLNSIDYLVDDSSINPELIDTFSYTVHSAGKIS